MDPARPLREVFAELAATGSPVDDPAGLLASHGHVGLPEHLVAEAVVSYADTAPTEVAEHLARYVMAHTPIGDHPGDDAASWFELLGTAPAGASLLDEPADLDDLPAGPLDRTGSVLDDLESDPGTDLDFGAGADEVADSDGMGAAGTPVLAGVEDRAEPADVFPDVEPPCGEPMLPAAEDVVPADTDLDDDLLE